MGEFLNDSAVLQDDLITFATGTATTPVKISKIVGNFTGSNLESTLDVEYGVTFIIIIIFLNFS